MKFLLPLLRNNLLQLSHANQLRYADTKNRTKTITLYMLIAMILLQHGGSDERQPEQPHGDGRAFTMIIQAELRRKQSEYEGEPCAVDKVIELPSQRFQQFSRALLADYDFIAENKNSIRHDDDARHCLLILDAEGKDGFLVDPQGYNYAR